MGAGVGDIGDPGVGGLAGVVANSPMVRFVVRPVFEGGIGNEIFDLHLCGCAGIGFVGGEC